MWSLLLPQTGDVLTSPRFSVVYTGFLKKRSRRVPASLLTTLAYRASLCATGGRNGRGSESRILKRASAPSMMNFPSTREPGRRDAGKSLMGRWACRGEY